MDKQDEKRVDKLLTIATSFQNLYLKDKRKKKYRLNYEAAQKLLGEFCDVAAGRTQVASIQIFRNQVDKYIETSAQWAKQDIIETLKEETNAKDDTTIS